MKTIGRLFILLSVLFFLGCTQQGGRNEKVTGKGGGEAQRGTSPLPPGSPVIGPDNATVKDALLLKSDISSASGEIEWFVNGVRAEDAKGVQFTSEGLRKGDAVQVRIMQGEQQLASNEIIIRNTPPVMIGARIAPEMPLAGSTLSVEATAEDADHDTVQLQYAWKLNNEPAGNSDSLSGEIKRDDEVAVEVTPYDGEDYGKSVTLKIKVFNSPPTVSEGIAQLEGTVFSYQVKASDPDGDPLTFNFVSGPSGAGIDEHTGLVTWPVGPETKGTFPMQVSITDGHGGKVIYGINATIGEQKSP
jgi:hypothetical protein